MPYRATPTLPIAGHPPAGLTEPQTTRYTITLQPSPQLLPGAPTPPRTRSLEDQERSRGRGARSSPLLPVPLPRAAHAPAPPPAAGGAAGAAPPAPGATWNVVCTTSSSDSLSSLSWSGRREWAAVEVEVALLSVDTDTGVGRWYGPAAIDVTSAGGSVVRTSTPSSLRRWGNKGAVVA
jgi:hypothetical protein